jgi:hypothetical protein
LGLEHIYILLPTSVNTWGFTHINNISTVHTSLTLDQLSTSTSTPKTTNQPTSTSQPHLTSHSNKPTNPPKMSSANWEQHFLDKFIASSSRPATPTSSQPQPRNASPARWRPSARYNGLSRLDTKCAFRFCRRRNGLNPRHVFRRCEPASLRKPTPFDGPGTIANSLGAQAYSIVRATNDE